MELPFREVYKCSWLKLPPTDKKCGNVLKQWVIFCVHNDSIPFLEVYADEKIALTHKPTNSYQLSNVLHITPSICPQDDDEFEFVITFPSEIVRYVASSQHQMMSWVKRLNAKLREMKLLAPNENLYTSHLPENRSHLLPTRDPNSPLPLPPAMPYIPPGVEPVSSSTAENCDETGLRGTSSGATQEGNQESIESNQISNTHLGSPRRQGWSTSQNRTVEIIDSTEVTNNVTVIEVSSSPGNAVFTFSDVSSELNNIEQNATVSFVPINSNFENVSIIRGSVVADTDDRSNQPNGNRSDTENGSVASNERANTVSENGDANESALYEHVFLSLASSTPQQVSSSSINNIPLSPGSAENHLHSPLTSVNLQSSSSSQQLPKMGRGRANVRGRRRSNSNSESSSSQLAADRIRTAGPIMNSSQRLQPPPHPFVRQVNSEDITNSRLTLREHQVMQLRREMSHPGGVRLQLRRKDCLNSIAFIDAFQAVWIAGWKQKEHPMLYTALHIGDQLISLGGKIVNNAADVQKLIRAWPSLYIEFVIRRVPCGRVYALRKDQEGQNLGIVQENNTAEIKEVVTKSIVAAQGLTTRVRTMNGLSWTTWYITEINGRPLNLFFKENEVRDRLNAVGLDMSLLVQPSDLIKQIKKQLKLVKNYKDYIVQ